MTQPFWVEERLERLLPMLENGDSYSTIAEAFGTTRNAVSGIVSRLRDYGELGNSARCKSERTARKRRASKAVEPAAKPAKPKKPSPPPPIAEVPAMPFVEPMECSGAAHAVLELHPHDCRWPIGDPFAAEFRFCGEKATRGPYCGCHAGIAYEKSTYVPKVCIVPIRDAWSAR